MYHNSRRRTADYRHQVIGLQIDWLMLGFASLATANSDIGFDNTVRLVSQDNIGLLLPLPGSH